MEAASRCKRISYTGASIWMALSLMWLAIGAPERQQLVLAADPQDGATAAITGVVLLGIDGHFGADCELARVRSRTTSPQQGRARRAAGLRATGVECWLHRSLSRRRPVSVSARVALRPAGLFATGLRPTSAFFVHCRHRPELPATDRAAFVVQPSADRSRPRSRSSPASRNGRRPSTGGKKQKIWRCPTCQVAVFGQYTASPRVRLVRGGTLDDPASVAPDVHLYAVQASLGHAARLAAGVPSVYYDTKKLWPAASLERLDALTASPRT